MSKSEDGGENLIRQVPVLAEVATGAEARRWRTARRFGVGLLTLVVVLALAEAFGPRDATATAQAGDGSELTVRYPKLTRPGLDTEIEVRWKGSAPLTEEVVVVVDQRLFSELGIELIAPEPEAQRSAGSELYLTFDAPRHREFSALFSGRLPTRQTAGSHSFSVRIDGVAESVAEARTWVLP